MDIGQKRLDAISRKFHRAFEHDGDSRGRHFIRIHMDFDAE